MPVPRIGRGLTLSTPPHRGVLGRPDPIQRALAPTADVRTRLERLPKALDELATRLRPLARHAQDAVAMEQLDALAALAWDLWIAVGRMTKGGGLA